MDKLHASLTESQRRTVLQLVAGQEKRDWPSNFSIEHLPGAPVTPNSIELLRNMIERHMGGEASDEDCEEEKSTNSTRTGTGSTNRSSLTPRASSSNAKRMKHLQLLKQPLDAFSEPVASKEGEGTSWEYVRREIPHGDIGPPCQPPVELPMYHCDVKRRFHTVSATTSSSLRRSSTDSFPGSTSEMSHADDADAFSPAKAHTTKVKVPKKRGAILLNGQLVITTNQAPPDSPTANMRVKNVTQIQVGGDSISPISSTVEEKKFGESWEEEKSSETPFERNYYVCTDDESASGLLMKSPNPVLPRSPTPEIVEKVKINIVEEGHEYFA